MKKTATIPKEKLLSKNTETKLCGRFRERGTCSDTMMNLAPLLSRFKLGESTTMEKQNRNREKKAITERREKIFGKSNSVIQTSQNYNSSPSIYMNTIINPRLTN